MILCGRGGMVSLLSPEPGHGLQLGDSVTLRTMLKEQQPQSEPEKADGSGTKSDLAVTLTDRQPGQGD